MLTYLLIGVSLWLMYYAWRGIMPRNPLNKLAISQPMSPRTSIAFGVVGIAFFYLGAILGILNM